MEKYVRSVIKKETLALVTPLKNKKAVKLPFYHDHTVLTWGKFKSTRLCDIPPDYLLEIYGNQTGCNDKSLLVYIRKNVERIKARKEGKVLILNTCKKKTYKSQEIAREILRIITATSTSSRKPIREYGCPHCGGWHLTSTPLIETKQSPV